WKAQCDRVAATPVAAAGQGARGLNDAKLSIFGLATGRRRRRRRTKKAPEVIHLRGSFTGFRCFQSSSDTTITGRPGNGSAAAVFFFGGAHPPRSRPSILFQGKLWWVHKDSNLGPAD